MKKKLLGNHAVQEGVLFLLLGVCLLLYSLKTHNTSYIKDWAQSPGLFPLIVSLLLCALASTMLVRGMGKNSGKADGKSGRMRRVLCLLGLCLAYVLSLSMVRIPRMAVTVFSLTLTLSAFEICTVVFLAAMMAFLGVRSKRLLFLVPLGTTAFVSVMFRTLLHVLLP